MAKGQTVHKTVRKWKTLRRMLLLIVVIGAAAVGWSAYNRYADPEHIRALAEAHLQQYAEGPVTVGSAAFSWWDGVRLFDVAVAEVSRAEPDQQPPHTFEWRQPVFSCREIELACSALSMIFGRLEFESIVAFEPTLVIVREAAGGSTNLTGLLRRTEAPGEAGAVSPPSIELRDARVRVVHRDGWRERLVEDLQLTIRGSAAHRDSRFYDIVWQGGGTQMASGHSQFDLATGGVRNVRGGLPWMSLEAVMIAVNARYEAAGAWCDLLGLGGRLRVQDYDFSPGLEPDAPRSATIELNNASLSIPIDSEERPLPPDDRYLRFDQVYGTIQVTADDLRAEFKGLFHGSECQVEATLRGGMDDLTTLDDVHFDARASVDRLELPLVGPNAPPEHVRFINHWQPLARFFRDYDPHGPVDLEIAVAKRAGVDEPIVIPRLALTARGGDASCRHFPYRGTDLSGAVEYTPEGIFIRGISGRHNGGIVHIDGWAEKPKRDAAIELSITGRDIPIDDEVLHSIPTAYKKIYDQFHPEGTLDVELTLNRPPGTGGQPAKWQPHTTLTFDDLSACYVKLPYPVEHLSGSLIVDRDKIRVVKVSGRSGEAHIGIDGVVAFSPDQAAEPDLTLTARNVAIDDKLLSALPDEVRGHLRAFCPTGWFDLKTMVKSTPGATTLNPWSDVVLRDVTIRHEVLPVTVEGISGSLWITPDRITIEKATGRYHGATVSAAGTVELDGTQTRAEVVIRTRDLKVDDQLRAAAPDGLREVLDQWRVDGPIATETTLRSNPEDAETSLAVRTMARLDGVSIRHPLFPIPFEEVRGEITFDESGARATGVEARYGQATVSVDFDTRRGDGDEEGTIALTAVGTDMDHSLRDILPERFRTAWDRRAPTGTVDLHLDRLRYTRSDPGGRRVWQVDGRVDMFDVAFRGAAEIDGMSGTFTVSGALVDRLGGTVLSGDLKASAVDLFGRHLTDVETPWSYALTAEGIGRFALDSVQGNGCGGMLKAELELSFDTRQTAYNLSTTVHDMEIGSLLRSRSSGTAAGEEDVNLRGRVDAHLYLSGQLGDPLAKRGGGRVEIYDCHIHRLPIMLAILNVINLSPPDEDAFDVAEADFFIVGDQMQLKDIVLEGRVLTLVGSGSMSLPDRGLDLDLVYMSSDGWARVPVLTEFIERASRSWTELHITGPLHRPIVRAQPFRGVTEELKRLFQKKKPKKIQPVNP